MFLLSFSTAEGAGVELIQLIRLSFSVLNRLLMLRPADMPPSPVEHSLSAQPANRSNRHVVATIAQYIYHRHDPRLPVLATLLLKRLAMVRTSEYWSPHTDVMRTSGGEYAAICSIVICDISRNWICNPFCWQRHKFKRSKCRHCKSIASRQCGETIRTTTSYLHVCFLCTDERTVFVI